MGPLCPVLPVQYRSALDIDGVAKIVGAVLEVQPPLQRVEPVHHRFLLRTSVPVSLSSDDNRDIVRSTRTRIAMDYC